MEQELLSGWKSSQDAPTLRMAAPRHASVRQVRLTGAAGQPRGRAHSRTRGALSDGESPGVLPRCGITILPVPSGGPHHLFFPKRLLHHAFYASRSVAVPSDPGSSAGLISTPVLPRARDCGQRPCRPDVAVLWRCEAGGEFYFGITAFAAFSLLTLLLLLLGDPFGRVGGSPRPEARGLAGSKTGAAPDLR